MDFPHPTNDAARAVWEDDDEFDTGGPTFVQWHRLLNACVIEDPLPLDSFCANGRMLESLLAGDALKYVNSDLALVECRAFSAVLVKGPKIQGHAMWGLPRDICRLLLDTAFADTVLGRIIAWAKQAYTRLCNKEKYYKIGLRRVVLLHPKIWACVQKIAGEDPGLGALHSSSRCWWCHEKNTRVSSCSPPPSRQLPESTRLCTRCFASLFDLVLEQHIVGFPFGWTLPTALFKSSDLKMLEPYCHIIKCEASKGWIAVFDCKIYYPKDRVEELRRQKEQQTMKLMASAFPSYCQPWSAQELAFPTTPPTRVPDSVPPQAQLLAHQWGAHSLREQVYSHHRMMYRIGRIDKARYPSDIMSLLPRGHNINTAVDEVEAALQEAVDARVEWLAEHPRPPKTDLPQVTQVAAPPAGPSRALTKGAAACLVLLCVVLCATIPVLRPTV